MMLVALESPIAMARSRNVESKLVDWNSKEVEVKTDQLAVHST